VPADEALRIGLVNRVVPAARLDAATLALGGRDRQERAVRRADDEARREPRVGCRGFRAAMAANTELDVMIETANLPRATSSAGSREEQA
jgi:enoyl-CoA hydratase/carnithine racemase